MMMNTEIIVNVFVDRVLNIHSRGNLHGLFSGNQENPRALARCLGSFAWYNRRIFAFRLLGITKTRKPCYYKYTMCKQKREIKMELKDKIKELRESTGMNRKEFCEYFGIPYRTVTEWERGTRKMPDYVLRLLAYQIKMEQLAEKMESKEKSGGI